MMRTKVDALIGKFFIEDDDDHEWYRIGQVVSALEHGYLICYDPGPHVDDAPTQPMVIMTHEELASVASCGHKRWSFFDSLRDLECYIKWIETPVSKPKPEGKVVKLTKQ